LWKPSRLARWVFFLFSGVWVFLGFCVGSIGL
jgi:hypothetical protein